jgi:cytochrome c553
MRWCVHRVRLAASALLLLFLIAFFSACQYGVTSPVSPTSDAAPVTAAGSKTLTYTTDIQPVLATDCVRCHGPSRRDAGVDLSTYASVMRTATPGNASSLLILVTRPGGVMYGQFSGNRSQKATLIHDWIVSSGAAR